MRCNRACQDRSYKYDRLHAEILVTAVDKVSERGKKLRPQRQARHNNPNLWAREVFKGLKQARDVIRDSGTSLRELVSYFNGDKNWGSRNAETIIEFLEDNNENGPFMEPAFHDGGASRCCELQASSIFASRRRSFSDRIARSYGLPDLSKGGIFVELKTPCALWYE